MNLGISLLPEGRRLFPYFIVKEKLLIGSYRYGARKGCDENLKYCYYAFPRLEERINSPGLWAEGNSKCWL